jgi:hypothetical protein
MFFDREDAAGQLAEQLRVLHLKSPLILASPRGGVVTGAVLARELGAELDVVLARKLRAPYQPELAIGAVGEDGDVYLNHAVKAATGVDPAYIERERRYQVAEIGQRQQLFRASRPQAEVSGRSVILTDDGIATGSTMIAALHVLRAQRPHVTIVAVPVAPPDRLQSIRKLCDQLFCLLEPENFYAIGQFYTSFNPVADDEVVRILRELSAEHRPKTSPHSATP